MSSHRGSSIGHNIHIGSRKRFKAQHKNIKTLATTNEKEKLIVVGNSDKKTLNMGIFPGKTIHIVKNNPVEANIVVSLGEDRIVLSKKIANGILVR